MAEHRAKEATREHHGFHHANEVSMAVYKELEADRDTWKARAEELERQPRLGLATTRELLAELTARIEVDGKLDYSTVPLAALSKQEPAQGGLPFEPNGPNPAFEPREPSRCSTCDDKGAICSEGGHPMDSSYPASCTSIPCPRGCSTPNTEGT